MPLGEPAAARSRAAVSEQRLSLSGWIALALYSAMVIATVARHEPWADEAQAWLIARDRGFGDMLWRGVRYEGTPGLWHALLWLPAHTGMPYAAMSWIAAAIAIAGVYVLLRFAPFPLPLRVLLPFTFFIGYQYAAVARSYVLFPLLCFAAAACFRSRKTLGLGVALGLLANVSSHGFVVAAGLALAYLWFLWRERGGPFRRAVPALAIYAAGALIAAATAWQPPDVSFVQPQFARILHRGNNNVAPALPAAQSPPVTAPASVKAKVTRAAHLFSLGFSTNMVFAAIVALACLAWLILRHGAVLLIPLAFLLFVLAAVYMSPWHAGMLFVALVTVLWIAWPSRSGLADYALAGLVCVVCLLQLPWTFNAVRHDISGPYDGSEACARYLASVHPGRIFGYTPYSTGILPWFRTNIFANQPRFSYWYWNKSNRTAQDPAEIAAGHPDLVVIAYEETLATPWSGTKIGIEPAVAELRDAARDDGYRLTRDFTGAMPMDNGFTAVNHCEVYARERQ